MQTILAEKKTRYTSKRSVSGNGLQIRRNAYFYQNAFIVEYRLVGAYADKILSEHVEHVRGKGERGQGTEELFAVAKEGMMYRHYIVAFFVKTTAAGIVQNDGKSAV